MGSAGGQKSQRRVCDSRSQFALSPVASNDSFVMMRSILMMMPVLTVDVCRRMGNKYAATFVRVCFEFAESGIFEDNIRNKIDK